MKYQMTDYYVEKIAIFNTRICSERMHYFEIHCALILWHGNYVKPICDALSTRI